MRHRRAAAQAILLLCLCATAHACGGAAAQPADASPTTTAAPVTTTATTSTTVATTIASTTTTTTTVTTTLAPETTTVPVTTVAWCRVLVPDPDEDGYFVIGFTSNQPGAAVAFKWGTARVLSATTNGNGAASIRLSLGRLQSGTTINFVATVGAAHCSTAYTMA
jgi:hypothetical protein